MKDKTSVLAAPEPSPADPAAPDLQRRARDAELTRQRLLEAARQRFSRDGYNGTTVRDIADDAGVNVSLINRYFDSKEGLFEACLRRVVRNLEDPDSERFTLDDLVQAIVGQVADISTQDFPLDLLLLLRSSGNQRADAIRADILRSFAEGMAASAGWPETRNDSEDALLLRAEVVLAAALGIVLVRSTTELQPLASATADEIAGPVGLVVQALLGRPPSA